MITKPTKAGETHYSIGEFIIAVYCCIDDGLKLHQQLTAQLGAFEVDLIDGLPMRLCCLTYAGRCQSFQGIAAFGYCAAKDESFYGFREHLTISLSGVITDVTITPANEDEREALWEITQRIRGLLIGDKGYLSQALQRQLATVNLDLQTVAHRLSFSSLVSHS